MKNFYNQPNRNSVSKPKRIYESIKEEDFLLLLKSTTKMRDKVILLLAYGSGLRLSEIINLQKTDIDVDSRNIFVRQGKGSKDRITILAKQFKKSYLEFIPINLTKMGVQIMFQKLLLKHNFNEVIGTYKTKTGKTKNLYKYRFHSLRHSFGTNLVMNGVPINVVQSLMGHSNISTTSRYTQLNAKDAIAIALGKGL